MYAVYAEYTCTLRYGLINHSHYHTAAQQGAHGPYSHSTLWSSFKCAAGVRVSLHLAICFFFFFFFWKVSYFRLVFCSFHYLPIFLLAQILMRADLGYEPQSARWKL